MLRQRGKRGENDVQGENPSSVMVINKRMSEDFLRKAGQVSSSALSVREGWSRVGLVSTEVNVNAVGSF